MGTPGPTPPPARADRTAAMLLGGALGDALGAPLEFHGLRDIERRHGPLGPTGFVESPDGRGRFTDDTQMTLFTAEGIVRARVAAAQGGKAPAAAVVHHAYLRWLLTQGRPPAFDLAAGRPGPWPDGWLVRERALWRRRAPGATCLSALESATALGSPARNGSKGCGGVMRAAPAALAPAGDAFAWGRDFAALTHGHPTGSLSAGALAEILRALLDGEELDAGVARACARLRACPHHEETLRAVERAMEAAGAGDPSPARVERLGEGWTGEEALAIGLYAAKTAPDALTGLRLAACHSGDSDSTASVAGNLLGAAGGLAALPRSLADALDADERRIVEAVARDLHGATGERPPSFDDASRYPGW